MCASTLMQLDTKTRTTVEYGNARQKMKTIVAKALKVVVIGRKENTCARKLPAKHIETTAWLRLV